jgi:hypothetical protein
MFVKSEWNSLRMGSVDGVKESNWRVNLIKIQDIHRWNTMAKSPFSNEYASRNVEQECKTGLYGGWVLGKGKGEYRCKSRANVIDTVHIVAWKESNEHMEIILNRGRRGENDDVDELNQDTLYHNKIPCTVHIC